MAFNWFQIAPEPDRRDWSDYDHRIGALAHQGVRVMPVLIRAPAWAANGNDRPSRAPVPELFGAFAREAVQRYGHGGTFWREHPAIPYRPVRDWQIWNEPDHPDFWDYPPWPRAFVPVLRAGAEAVRATDPQARVVAPGLTNRPFEGLYRLYRNGARGLFDVAAVHPYRRTPELVMAVVKRTRRLMNRWGDDELPIMVTEMTFSSARGHATVVGGWESNERGQAKRLREMLQLLARDRTRYDIDSAYWYTWMDGPIGKKATWFYSGVRRQDRRGRLVTKPALSALRSAIKRATRTR
jgi:hypothetical protein